MPLGTGILSGTAAVVLGGVLMVGAAVYDAGAIRVQVDEKKPNGTHLHLIAPAAMVPVGLRFVPDGQLREASEQIRPWIPVIKTAIDELKNYQDFTLVEVEDGNEHVKITKQGRQLVIDVNSDDEEVHVTVPFRTMLSAVERIERVQPET